MVGAGSIGRAPESKCCLPSCAVAYRNRLCRSAIANYGQLRPKCMQPALCDCECSESWRRLPFLCATRSSLCGPSACSHNPSRTHPPHHARRGSGPVHCVYCWFVCLVCVFLFPPSTGVLVRGLLCRPLVRPWCLLNNLVSKIMLVNSCGHIFELRSPRRRY